VHEALQAEAEARPRRWGLETEAFEKSSEARRDRGVSPSRGVSEARRFRGVNLRRGVSVIFLPLL
jgi:hypothetical protein